MKTIFLFLFLVIFSSARLFAEVWPSCPIEAGYYEFENSNKEPIKVRCQAIQMDNYIVADFGPPCYTGYFMSMGENNWYWSEDFHDPLVGCRIRLFIDSKTSFRARFEHHPKQPMVKLNKVARLDTASELGSASKASLPWTKEIKFEGKGQAPTEMAACKVAVSDAHRLQMEHWQEQKSLCDKDGGKLHSEIISVSSCAYSKATGWGYYRKTLQVNCN